MINPYHVADFALIIGLSLLAGFMVKELRKHL